jgi:hypothetical protein
MFWPKQKISSARKHCADRLRGSLRRRNPEEIKTFEVNRNFYIDAGKSNLVTDSL